jgi:hypothetical protein
MSPVQIVKYSSAGIEFSERRPARPASNFYPIPASLKQIVLKPTYVKYVRVITEQFPGSQGLV